LNSVFHWVEDQRGALAEIYRVLKAGGRLGLSCQDTDHPHEAFLFLKRAVVGAAPDLDFQAAGLSSCELEALVTSAGFVAYKADLRNFVSLYQDVDALLASISSSSFGNFLADVSEVGRARIRDALDRLLEPKRLNREGIRLERYVTFATARKPIKA
jgi:SAM-dependent methyltransferase